MTDHKMTPEQYQAAWELPRSYPLVAPNYAKTRSALAKKIGLGRNGSTQMNAGRKATRKTRPGGNQCKSPSSRTYTAICLRSKLRSLT